MITLLTMHELHGLTAQELGELHQLFSMLLIASSNATRSPPLADCVLVARRSGQETGHRTGQNGGHKLADIKPKHML